MNIDEVKYAATIPRWCSKQTLKEHTVMGLCWSLLEYVRRSERCPLVNCYRCRLRDPEITSDS